LWITYKKFIQATDCKGNLHIDANQRSDAAVPRPSGQRKEQPMHRAVCPGTTSMLDPKPETLVQKLRMSP
jgi:hypothetical protein